MVGTKTTARVVQLCALTLLLIGCGGDSRPPRPVGFENYTFHSDADLWSIWKKAQTHLAATIDLNPIQRQFYNAAAEFRPGDSRAVDVVPRELRVSRLPDVSSTVLLSDTGMDRPDPTGMIPCPQPCNVRYAPAYSLYTQNVVNYAASWEAHENDFQTILQYEFENHILFALGYDVSWR